MKSPIVKRSVNLDGHKTSVSLENAFWDALKQIATVEKLLSTNLSLKSTTNASAAACRRPSVCSFSNAIANKRPPNRLPINCQLGQKIKSRDRNRALAL